MKDSRVYTRRLSGITHIEAIANAINRRNRSTFTSKTISEASECPLDRVSSYFTVLRRAGYIEIVGKDHGRTYVYKRKKKLIPFWKLQGD